MAQTLSFPFRLTPTGAPATVEQDTDEHYGELLLAMLLTQPGERQLAPSFGVADPVFDGYDLGEIRAGVEVFGPPVEVTDLGEDYSSATTQDVTVSFA